MIRIFQQHIALRRNLNRQLRGSCLCVFQCRVIRVVAPVLRNACKGVSLRHHRRHARCCHHDDARRHGCG